MPYYIFTQVIGNEAWELVEALKSVDAATKVLADYRSFLKEQAGAQVVMIEAKTVGKAREKLEFDLGGT